MPGRRGLVRTLVPREGSRVMAGQSEDTESREGAVGPSDQHSEVGSSRKSQQNCGDHKGAFHPPGEFAFLCPWCQSQGR